MKVYFIFVCYIFVFSHFYGFTNWCVLTCDVKRLVDLSIDAALVPTRCCWSQHACLGHSTLKVVSAKVVSAELV